MKRFISFIVFFVCLISLTVSSVNAVGPYNSTGNCASTGVGCIPVNPAPLTSQNGGAGCTVTTTQYYQWSQLAGITETIGSTTITVSSPSNGGGIDGVTVTLYGTADNNLPAGGLGAALGTVILPSSAPAANTLTFNGISGSALVTYLNAARSGGPYTFALQISQCTASVANLELSASASLAVFNSSAVTLSTFRAADSSSGGPLMVALAGLAVAVLAAAFLLRRRFA